ncbi:CaiB/BaiF CoA-transferase family protein [uncultured Aeromicrobium sp.]|uniref:CaiB/BaiF CoA transferase family protein n=1 Tax=uncultured Aeromicrobium sp. TaxID=337820 RepID=UPI0025D2D1B2|nr:CoA transferase [uncultured Aeromicrobium sp.]
MAADRTGPLQGVRVIDLSRALAGPYATMMLADAGADVVKVEPPSGDDSRGWLPHVERGDERASAYFLSANRGKKSVVLDLKDPQDADRLRWLVSDADVLVENYRPGVLDRLGLSVDSLRARNPRLVTLSLTGFGAGGPESHRPGFDQIIQAEAGLMSLTGEPDGPPQRVGLPISDILAGMFGAFGVVSALRERDETGRAPHVDASLLSAVVGVHVFQGAGWLAAGREPRRTGNRHPSIAPYGVFSCSDADIVVAVGSESLWRRFAEAVGIDPDAPGLATNAERIARVEELEAQINAAFADAPAAQILAMLDAAGVPAGRIRSIPEVYAWDQVRATGLVTEVEHPRLGSVELPGPAVRWSTQSAPPALAPPDLDADRDEVFAHYPHQEHNSA